MPKRTMKMRRRGAGIKEVLQKIHGFVKKHKLLSRGASVLAPYTGKYGKYVSKAGNVAGALGYGRRRGGLLRLAGGMKTIGL